MEKLTLGSWIKVGKVNFFNFDPTRVPSPCFVVDEVAVENNLKILNRVQEESGAKVLLALKAFSMFSLAPLITKYLSGTCSSGLHEAFKVATVNFLKLKSTFKS